MTGWAKATWAYRAPRVLLVIVFVAALGLTTGGRASASQQLPTFHAGSRAAVLGTPNGGNLAVFFNSDGFLKLDFYLVTQNRWTGPQVLPGTIHEFDSPVAIGSPDGGNMAVFFKDIGGKLEYDYYNVVLNAWGGPFQLSSDIQGDPAVIGDTKGGNIAVFFRDSHNHLNEDFYFGPSNTWSGVFPIATAIDDSPVAIGNPNGGNFAVFYTSNSVLLESFYMVAQNKWNPPVALATQVKGPATVLGSPDVGNIAVFYVTSTDTNNVASVREVYYFHATNSWGGPYTLPGASAPNVNGPVAAIGSPNSGDIRVYFNYSSNVLLGEDVYHVATNTWSGPTIVRDVNGSSSQLMPPTQPTAVGDPSAGSNRAVFFNCCARSNVDPNVPFTGPLFDLEMAYSLAGTGTWTFSLLAYPFT
jgi:hypothetical protein